MKTEIKQLVNGVVGLISMILMIAEAARLWGWDGAGLALGITLFASALSNEIMWHNE